MLRSLRRTTLGTVLRETLRLARGGRHDAVSRPHMRASSNRLAALARLDGSPTESPLSPSLTRPLLTRFGAPGQAIDERPGGGEEGQSDAEAITGMRSPNGILLFLLVLTAVLLLLFIVGGVVGLRRIAGVPTLRLSRTGQRPELSLHRGVLWHLFNSHIWSTGQDAAAAIKKELQLLLPGINVFLDARAHRITAPLIARSRPRRTACAQVDDLEDIGALETYIRQSQLILCFLSRGYLRSANCLREVCAALDQGVRPFPSRWHSRGAVG